MTYQVFANSGIPRVVLPHDIFIVLLTVIIIEPLVLWLFLKGRHISLNIRDLFQLSLIANLITTLVGLLTFIPEMLFSIIVAGGFLPEMWGGTHPNYFSLISILARLEYLRPDTLVYNFIYLGISFIITSLIEWQIFMKVRPKALRKNRLSSSIWMWLEGVVLCNFISYTLLAFYVLWISLIPYHLSPITERASWNGGVRGVASLISNEWRTLQEQKELSLERNLNYQIQAKSDNNNGFETTIDSEKIIVKYTPTKKGVFKSTTGVLYFENFDLSLEPQAGIMCRTRRPSQVPPEVPKLESMTLTCPSNSEIVYYGLLTDHDIKPVMVRP